MATPQTNTGEWVIRASKKGDILISTERRPLSKDVTLIKQVEKNAISLLTALRKKFGTGGTTYGSTVEIQGLLVEETTKFLLAHPHCFIGIRKDLLAPSKKDIDVNPSLFITDIEKKERKKPRHKNKDLGIVKDVSVNNYSAYGFMKCENSKERCPHDWPYCSGWCYEPDSEPEDEVGEKLDFSQFDTPWLLNDELNEESDSTKGQQKEVHFKPMSSLEIATSLRLLGLAATPCSCNDGSTNKLKASQKREKVMKRQLDRAGVCVKMPSNHMFQSETPRTSSRQMKPMFLQNHASRESKNDGITNRQNTGSTVLHDASGTVSYAAKVQGHRYIDQRDEDVGFSNQYDGDGEDDNVNNDLGEYAAPCTFEFSFEDHVSSLGLRKYEPKHDESSAGTMQSDLEFSLDKSLMMTRKKQGDNFPALVGTKKKKKQAVTSKRQTDLQKEEEDALAQALEASMLSSQADSRFADISEEEAAMKRAIEASLQVREELYLDDDLDQLELEELEQGNVNTGGGGGYTLDERLERRQQSASFLDAMSLLVVMGFEDDEATRAALLQAEGDDVCYAIEILTKRRETVREPKHIDERRTVANDSAAEDIKFNQSGRTETSAQSCSTSSFQHQPNISDWLIETLSKHSVEDSPMYAEYILSFLNELQEEHSLNKCDVDLNDRVFEWSSSLSTLLAEILPHLNEALLQSISFEATSIFLST